MKKYKTEKEAYFQYDNMLNELYPLDGICCNPFSLLLAKGDPIAYDCRFTDFCDAEGIEIEENQRISKSAICKGID